MKHVRSVTRYVGLELDETQVGQLETYRDWLATEGHRAGGIGPGEISRIEYRHLADSLLFASQMDRDSRHVVDLGTGVGLPGIPLALAMPEKTFTLVDRSQRRVDLVRRFLRILEVENCQVIRGEIRELEIQGDVVVARASLSPDELRPIVPRLLSSGGVAVVGGSWQQRPSHPGWETIGIPRDVLDRPIWLLMMRSA